MANEIENHTVRLLQEMRESIGRIDENLQAMRTEVADLTQRVDGNTLVFNLVAGVVHDHEERIGRLEGDRA